MRAKLVFASASDFMSNQRIISSFHTHRLFTEPMKSVRHKKITFWQKVSNFFLEFGITPRRLKQFIIGLAVILGLALIVYLFRVEPVRRTNMEELLTVEEKTDREIDRLAALVFSPSELEDQVYILGELDSRKKKIEELHQQSSVSKDQKFRLQHTRLMIEAMIAFNSIEKGNSAKAQLQEIESSAKAWKLSGDEKLVSAANFILCLFAVKAFCEEPTDETAQVATDSLSRNQACYLSQLDRSNEIAVLLVRKQNQNVDNGLFDQCIAHLGNILSKSENVENRQLAVNLFERVEFAKFRLISLEQRIRYHNPDAVRDIEGTIEQLRQKPEVTTFRWRQIIRCNEAFISIFDTQKFEQTQEALTEIAGTIPDSNPGKKEIQELLSRQKMRLLATGKPFDISGNAINRQEQLQSIVSDYALVVFADLSIPSAEVLKQHNTDSGKLNKKYTTIVAFKSVPSDPSKLTYLAPELAIVSEETSSQYFDQLPIDFLPASILVDNQGIIVATNLYPGQVDNAIAIFASKKEASLDRD